MSRPFSATLVPVLLLAAAATLLLPTPALAQDTDDADTPEWDVTLARGETREIDFETDEGTWMSVDMSPDGNWIVFDLLAHVYRVPAEGGQAESLTQESGVAVNYHPRYSHDGNHIAFVSDRGGQNNLWVMDADGSNPRQVQSSQDTRVTMPEWTADGQYILVAQGGGIWMYHMDGGTGIEVVSSDDGSAAWPSVSADGRYLYYHVRTPGSTVPWAVDQVDGEVVRDALQGTMNLRRMDLETGDVIRVHQRHALPPVPAFGRRGLRRGNLPRRSPRRLRTASPRRHHRVEGPRVRAEHGALDPRPGVGR